MGKECIECESVFHNCYGGTFGSVNDQVEEVIISICSSDIPEGGNHL